MLEFILSMLSKGGVSSKRFWGSVIIGMLCFAYMYCVFEHTEMPEATYGFMSLAAVLLGIETVFSKSPKTVNENE